MRSFAVFSLFVVAALLGATGANAQACTTETTEVGVCYVEKCPSCITDEMMGDNPDLDSTQAMTALGCCSECSSEIKDMLGCQMVADGEVDEQCKNPFVDFAICAASSNDGCAECVAKEEADVLGCCPKCSSELNDMAACQLLADGTFDENCVDRVVDLTNCIASNDGCTECMEVDDEEEDDKGCDDFVACCPKCATEAKAAGGCLDQPCSSAPSKVFAAVFFSGLFMALMTMW